MTKNYYIRGEYVCNPPPRLDNINASDREYWNKKRIKRSYNNNYYVYKYASEIALAEHSKSILDIGCGVAGKLMDLFAPISDYICGLDSPTAINYCKSKYSNAIFINVDFESITPDKLPIQKKFDMIISADVIEHLENPEKILKLIKAFSDSKTHIILSTPERITARGKNNLRSPNKHHVREWSYDEFSRFIFNSGFKIIKHMNIAPIKPNISFYFIKQIFYSMLTFSRYITRGTQLIHIQIMN